MIAVTRKNLAELDPQSADDVRNAGRSVVQFSPALWEDLKVLRKFMFTRMYRAPSVMKVRKEVTQVVMELFPHYMEHPEHLPPRWQVDVEACGEDKVALARVVADYVSGMTDRYAIEIHDELLGGPQKERLRALPMQTGWVPEG